MATITAIERQKRRRRFDVHLDGALAFDLSLDLVVERHLAVGDEISPAKQRDLEKEDARRSAMTAALTLFAHGPRSERDLRDRLRRRGLPAEAIDTALTRMRELGYLNDAAYARSYVEARQSATPRSRR